MLGGQMEIEAVCLYLNMGVMSVTFMKRDTKWYFFLDPKK